MKALITATVVRFIDRFEKNDIKLLQDRGYEVVAACNINRNTRPEAVELLREMDVQIEQIDFARSPFASQNLTAYKQLKKLIAHGGFEVVHCHTPVAGILTRLAARKARKKGTRVIYTAHGFHFFKGAPLLNWLTFYPAEWLCARLCDAIVTITADDFELAKRRFKTKKIYYVPGVGVNTASFAPAAPGEKERLKGELFGLPEQSRVLLSVGEQNVNKNHATVMRAVKELDDPSLWYLLCGVGDRREALEALAKELGIADRVIFAGLRRDIDRIYHCADVFCLPSFREGLSVSTMEAMASGLPIVVSKIRGNTDLIKENKGGYLVDPNNAAGFARAISDILTSPDKARSFGEYNAAAVDFFSEQSVVSKMDAIYSELLS